MCDADLARQTIQDLRALGVAVAIDDFGTGYFSLAHIYDFDIDAIKIGRTFVASLGTNSKANAIVNALATLARDLGIDIIVEGIETQDQIATLIDLGVTSGQGFYLAHPNPPTTPRLGTPAALFQSASKSLPVHPSDAAQPRCRFVNRHAVRLPTLGLFADVGGASGHGDRPVTSDGQLFQIHVGPFEAQ